MGLADEAACEVPSIQRKSISSCSFKDAFHVDYERLGDGLNRKSLTPGIFDVRRDGALGFQL